MKFELGPIELYSQYADEARQQRQRFGTCEVRVAPVEETPEIWLRLDTFTQHRDRSATLFVFDNPIDPWIPNCDHRAVITFCMHRPVDPRGYIVDEDGYALRYHSTGSIGSSVPIFLETMLRRIREERNRLVRV